jgi:hypothetical protein
MELVSRDHTNKNVSCWGGMMNDSADAALRADIEEEFRQFDAELGVAVYRLYQASWILREKLPHLVALPAVAIDEIRRAMEATLDERAESRARAA